MGKLKPRIKGKGKRWAKGQSSSSNPKTTKFREAAKTRFFSPNLGTTSALTIGAIKTHEAFTKRDKIPTPVPSDAGSEVETSSAWSDGSSASSGFSGKTFASVYSDCSNVSFSKFIQNFQPKSALHTEMLAVLSAVTEVIKAKNGTESSTEYFGALMTALDASDTQESTAAILSLLSMGVKSLPQEILRMKFSDVSKSVLDVLAKYSEEENFVIFRTAIGLLSVLLRAQDSVVWSYSSTMHIYQSVLVFTVHSKPKVRKAAQYAVVAILKGSSLISEESSHPAAGPTAKFCVHQIQESTSFAGGTTTLHVLTLLKEILSTFPKNHIKSTCEAILKLLTLGKVMMTKCCFQALHGLFICAPPATRLTPTLNAQLINALFDYQPAITDWESAMAWLSVMQEAYCNLVRIDSGLCAENLLKLFTTVSQLWLTDNPRLLVHATLTLRTIILDCLPNCSEYWNYSEITQNIFSVVEGGLKYQYHNAWPQVLNLLAALFQVLGADAESFTGHCLKSLADLRDSYNFAYTAELEFTVGRAIRTLGPESVLKQIPLNITGKEINYEFKRGWLLPVLKENVQTSTLEYFIRYFLPMANICRKRSEELEKAKDTVGTHSYELLCCQIWALLPSFCNNPSDVALNFRSIAPTLGVVLRDRKALRLSVLSSLRKLITKSQENNNEENLKVLGGFAKNYLPLLFNIYTTKPVGSDEEGQRLATFDTIKIYLTVTKSDLCYELFDKALGMLEGADPFMKESVLDLVKAILPYLDLDRVERVYSTCLNHLKASKNIHEEKKSYRLLEDLCSSEAKVCREFMTGKIPEIQKMLLKSLKHKKVTNAGARLRCLRHLVRLLPQNQFHVIKTIVPEAVLRCKDPNAKTRACAFDLLTDMLNVSKEWSEKADDELIRDYFTMLLGGLAGSPTLVSATLLGLAKLTFVLREELPLDVLQTLLESISVLLATPTREVTAACLSFIKTFISSYRRDAILPHVPLIVQSIISMTEDCKRHSRIKVRDILDRLLRKYDYETIKVLIPEDDAIMQKRLKNLRKINARKKKLKDAAMEDNEDEDDMQFSVKNKPKSIEEILASSDESDEEEEEPQPQKGRRKGPQMYIREDEDDIVDLISPAAASKLSARKPSIETTMKEKKKEPGFKMTSDGRLIITKEQDDRPVGKSREDSINFNDSEDDVDDAASAFSKVEIGKKRKLSASSQSLASGATSKYQAGGRGIHRPIPSKLAQKKQKTNDDGGVKTGKEYRAKKARGDVKVRGKPDPYAYIPLSRKMLSKRKKAKMSSKFKSVIKGAVKGAKTGSKIRRKK